MQASASKFSEEKSAYLNQIKKTKTCELKQAARCAHTEPKMTNYTETYIWVKQKK